MCFFKVRMSVYIGVGRCLLSHFSMCAALSFKTLILLILTQVPLTSSFSIDSHFFSYEISIESSSFSTLRAVSQTSCSGVFVLLFVCFVELLKI